MSIRNSAISQRYRILRELVGKGIDVTRFELVEPTLHEIFVQSVEAHGGVVQDAE